MNTKVIINGANGKMGSITVETISNQPEFTLVAKTTRGDDLAHAIQQHGADIVIDFTTPEVVFTQAQTIIREGARPIIGTTGLTHDQIDTLKSQCQNKNLGGIIAPNFSIGAILMMKYAQDAMRYFEDAEIIELHHPQKKDAPSGTAIKTALMMESAKTHQHSRAEGGARGERHHGTQIHSVRLPGLVAHQTVMLGGFNETLTIRHDSIHRSAFMPGVLHACRKVMELNQLVYGLEHVL